MGSARACRCPKGTALTPRRALNHRKKDPTGPVPSAKEHLQSLPLHRTRERAVALFIDDAHKVACSWRKQGRPYGRQRKESCRFHRTAYFYGVIDNLTRSHSVRERWNPEQVGRHCHAHAIRFKRWLWCYRTAKLVSWHFKTRGDVRSRMRIRQASGGSSIACGSVVMRNPMYRHSNDRIMSKTNPELPHLLDQLAPLLRRGMVWTS